MATKKLYKITWTDGRTQYKEFYLSDASSIEGVGSEFLKKKRIEDTSKLILVDEVDSGQKK